MKISVICGAKDKGDLEAGRTSLADQTYHDIQAICLCDVDLKSAINSLDSEYTIFIDALDTISVDYVRMMAAEARRAGSDLIACDIAYRDSKSGEFVYSNLSPLRSLTVDYDNAKLTEMYDKYGRDTADFGSPYGKCIRTQLLKDALDSMPQGDAINPDDLYSNIIRRTSRFTNIHGAYYFMHEMPGAYRGSFFNSILTPISKGFSEYEEMKRAIAGSRYKVISFDVFDTLILRNVYEPADLFQFMDEDYNSLFETTACTRFFLMRMCAEDVCRKRVLASHKDYEDITLDEIYDTMADLYQLDPARLGKLKEKEIRLELELCKPRNCAKDLYDLAIYCGKRVICTSDMYLPKEIISEILKSNGYTDITDIYVSSETRAGKYTGKAYRLLPTWTGQPSEAILHIGDNYKTDVEQARNSGITSFYLPKASDLFWGKDKDMIKGESAAGIFLKSAAENDYHYPTEQNLGLKCLLSQVINKFFDNPFTGFDTDSDYDIDPYYIGYFALGMHMWALADWITGESGEYSKIHFLSRDGYVLKQVYDIMNRDRQHVPSCYTYMSRNIVALGDMAKKEDLWAIRDKVTAYAATPGKMVKMLRPGIDKASDQAIESELQKHNISFEEEVGDEENFAKAINVIAKYVDWEKINDYRSKLKDYYRSIFAENECIVDAGYNGRVEAAIGELTGIKLDSFYFHAGQDVLYERENRYAFKNRCFYNSHPIVSYMVREQFVSTLQPSVTGIEFIDDKPELKFGDHKADRYTEFITQTIQDSALLFAGDMMDSYSRYLKYIKYRPGDASRAFDHLCNQGKDIDIKIFSCTEFENDFAENVRLNLSDLWKELMEDNKVQTSDNRSMEDYKIFKKYYQKAEGILPKGSKRRAAVRNTVKFILRK